MMSLSEIRPTRLRRVIDLVREAGLDVSDWNSSRNPAFCYAWSFSSKSAVVLNLWFDNMRLENGLCIQRHNFRKLARSETASVRKGRAQNMDLAVQYAYKNHLPVRVIILDRNSKSAPAKAKKRELDTVGWAVTSYNDETGDWTITRGATPLRFVDQYSAAAPEVGKPSRRDVSGSAFVREREVRDRALSRAGGNCEYCGERGFEMHNGNIYLETHHIIPLSEGGKDIVTNVAALCANDHRRAHHAKGRNTIRAKLLERIASKVSA